MSKEVVALSKTFGIFIIVLLFMSLGSLFNEKGLTGKAVDVGSYCASDSECQKNLYCKKYSGRGICEIKLSEGSMCERTGYCKDGLFCKSERCEQKGRIGSYCETNEGCRAGLACQSKTCVELRASS